MNDHDDDDIVVYMLSFIMIIKIFKIFQCINFAVFISIHISLHYSFKLSSFSLENNVYLRDKLKHIIHIHIYYDSTTFIKLLVIELLLMELVSFHYLLTLMIKLN